MTSPYDNRTFVDSPTKLPTKAHWAIIRESAHDDGYGGHAKHIEYTAFDDREVWEAEIARLTNERGFTPFKAMYVQPAEVKVSVSVRTPT